MAQRLFLYRVNWNFISQRSFGSAINLAGTERVTLDWLMVIYG